MTEKYSLTASQEDYLEAIYLISEEKMAARAKDIADFLKVRASSVTSALRTLGSMELVNYAPYDIITLTKEGKKIAAEIVQRHNTLKRFLVNILGVDEPEAEEAACKMEHSIPKTIIDRIVKYSEYVETCPKGGITWDNGFGYYCKDGCCDTTCSRNKAE